MTIEDIGLEPSFDEPTVEKKKKKKRTAKETLVEVEDIAETAESSEPAPKKVKKTKKQKKREARAKAAGFDDVEHDEVNEEITKPEEIATVDKKKKKKRTAKEAVVAVDDVAESAESSDEPKRRINKEVVDQLLEKLVEIQHEVEARYIITDNCEGISPADVAMVVQKWRQQKRRKAKDVQMESIVETDGSLAEVKAMVNNLVHKHKINRIEAGDIIRRWKMRERRRVGRQFERKARQTCLYCRQEGHMVSNCPNKSEEGAGGGTSGICFKCGSGEHNIYTCPRKNVKGFPFATCYICKQQGHLSRDCGKNSKGIYPDGGSCAVCGSTMHLKKDCPELAKQKNEKKETEVVATTMSAMSSADDDTQPKKNVEKTQKKKRVVQF